jgi:Flp pilus assembly protein TadG
MTLQTSRSERGSVSLWLVLSSFVMIILVGLAVDLSGQVHAQQRAHDLAAQAARAGGERVQAAPAIQGRYVDIDTASARAAAQDYLTAAGVDGTVAVAGSTTGRAMITVHVTDSYQPLFLGLLGIHRFEVSGSATARLIRSVGGTER